MKGRSHKAKGTQQKSRPKSKDRHKLANLRKPIQRGRSKEIGTLLVDIGRSYTSEMIADPRKFRVTEAEQVINVKWGTVRVSKELQPDFPTLKT